MARSIALPKINATVIGDGLKVWEEATEKNMERRLAPIVQAHAQKVAARATELVPEKTGLLKSTIHVKQGKNPLRATVRTDHGKAPHDYLVHFGTVNSEGRPFLYQANEQLEGDLKNAVAAEVSK